MKVRGSLYISKNLVLPSTGSSTAALGLVAMSDANGTMSWKRFYVLDVDESLSYPKGTFVMDGEDLYFSKTDNAPGTLPLNALNWTQVGDAGAGGTQLTQDQIDALDAANSPSGINAYATLADVANLTLEGSDTVANILAKSPTPENRVWIATDTGVDSFTNPVIVGDGLTSTGTGWLNIGQLRGPQGEKGDTGSGTKLVGSDTVANILLKDPVAGENTMWLALDTGVDDNSDPVAIGDGLVSDGVQWLTVGPVRGPEGPKGDTGSSGSTVYTGTYMIQGGVQWLSGYQYRVVADKYVIAGVLYSTQPAIITLPSADPVLNRRDYILVDTAGNIYSRQGDGVSNPISNDAIELRITYIDVVANTTVDPAITETVIYDEGTGGEWTATVVETNGASVDLAYAVDQVSGSVSTRVDNGRDVVVTYDAPGPVTINTEFGALSFRMKSLLATSNAVITMSLYDSGSGDKVGISLNAADFGYDYTNTVDWQYVTMYVNYFDIFASTFDQLELRISDPTLSERSDFLIDNIRYQYGIYVRPDTQFIEYTSQLINNGDGVSPFATLNDLAAAPAPTLEEVTTEGNSSSNDIVVATDVNNTLTVKSNGSIEFQNGPSAIATLDGDHTGNITLKLPTQSGTLALNNTYVHTEGAASALWSVNHNLNKYPSVTVVNTGNTTIDAVVTYVDLNNLSISVTPASAGYAYLN